MKKLLVLAAMSSMIYFISCDGGDREEATNDTNNTESASSAESSAGTSDYDPTRGEGKWDESNMNTATFDAALAAKGKQVSEVKCFSCHKITDEKLVGPGWKGVSERRQPHWIMNFITNPDPMIDKDPEVQAQLELCLVRMPNQSLTDDDARAIVEYMREVDGAK